MKKRIKDILSISRPQRIGLWCILAFIVVILFIRYSGSNSNLPENYSSKIDSFKSELDSCKVDTIIKRKTTRKSKKYNRKKKDVNNYNKNESLPRIED